MLHTVLARIQDAIIARPWRVLLGTLVAVVVALALGSQVELRTSRSELTPPDDPDQQRFDQFLRESGGASDLIACVEAAPGETKAPADLRAFADALAAEFRNAPEVARVFHKVDLDWFLDHGFHLAPPAMIRQAVAAARGESGALEKLAALRGVADLNDLVAGRLEKGLAEGNTAPKEEEAAEGIGYLIAFLRHERRFLEDPEGLVSELAADPPLVSLAGDHPVVASRGYLATHDGKTLFLLVSPRDPDDSLPTLQKLVGAMKARAAKVEADHPGFHVAFTGESATTVEEMDVVERDTWFTSLISAAGVAVLTLFVFRWKSHALLVLASLGVGVACAFGAVRLELGYLNLITSSFISTLVGLGIVYGIHPVSEYELQGAHTGDPAEAIRKAYRATGAAVTVGAVTTSAAFLSILLMKFRGFAELGLVAGIGVLLCLIAAMVTLPALLLVYGRWRHARHVSVRAGSAVEEGAGDGAGSTSAAGSPVSRPQGGAAVDRLWVEHGAGLVCRFPRTTTAVSLVMTAALGWAAWGVGFDPDILALLPRNSESVRYQNRMIKESDLSPNFVVAVADDLEGLRSVSARAMAEPTVDRVESVLQVVPEDPEASRAALAELSEFLGEIRLPSSAGPIDRGKIEASLRRLEAALSQASDAAFGAGYGKVAAPLVEARKEAEGARAFVSKSGPEQEKAWEEGERGLLAWAELALADLRRAAGAAAPTPDHLPSEVKEHLLTSTGRFIAYIYPKGDVFEPAFLDTFVEAARRISPEAAGFPIVFRTMTSRITSGFHVAATTAGALVLLLLFAKFRNVKDTLLALIPKVMGVIWMMGGMRLLGLSYNFANLVAIPLILGVGIDTGVHVIHRMRLEGSSGMTVVLRHTGRAILIAGLTTMIGFGSLALASHRGLASLGTVLLLGLGSCVLTATVVLPNILVAFGVAKR